MTECISNLYKLDPDYNYFGGNNLDSDIQTQSKYYTISEYNSILRLESIDHTAIIGYNIRSFHANFSPFQTIFDPNLSPEIIVLSETWFELNNLGVIPGYCAFHTIRESQRSGGVLVFVLNSFRCQKNRRFKFFKY